MSIPKSFYEGNEISRDELNKLYSYDRMRYFAENNKKRFIQILKSLNNIYSTNKYKTYQIHYDFKYNSGTMFIRTNNKMNIPLDLVLKKNNGFESYFDYNKSIVDMTYDFFNMIAKYKFEIKEITINEIQELDEIKFTRNEEPNGNEEPNETKSDSSWSEVN